MLSPAVNDREHVRSCPFPLARPVVPLPFGTGTLGTPHNKGGGKRWSPSLGTPAVSCAEYLSVSKNMLKKFSGQPRSATPVH